MRRFAQQDSNLAFVDIKPARAKAWHASFLIKVSARTSSASTGTISPHYSPASRRRVMRTARSTSSSSPVGGGGRTGCGPPPLRKRRARTQKQKGGDQLFARQSSLPNVSGITLFPSSPQGDGLSRCLCTARALASSANTLSGNAAARAKRVSQSPAPLRCDVLVIRVACG
jgi:hypothetical protein